MAKQTVKIKTKAEPAYTLTVPFYPDCTIDERESIIRRAIYREQALYTGKPFKFIIAEKNMEFAKINIFVKKAIKSKKKP